MRIISSFLMLSLMVAMSFAKAANRPTPSVSSYENLPLYNLPAGTRVSADVDLLVPANAGFIQLYYDFVGLGCRFNFASASVVRTVKGTLAVEIEGVSPQDSTKKKRHSTYDIGEDFDMKAKVFLNGVERPEIQFVCYGLPEARISLLRAHFEKAHGQMTLGSIPSLQFWSAKKSAVTEIVAVDLSAELKSAILRC
jgi:hypothetical protein